MKESTSEATVHATAHRSNFWFWLDVGGCLAACVLYVGMAVPHVNETHYLTKAKHFYDPSFCPGDAFLDSADAHWMFYGVFGVLPQFLSLPVSAWIARLVCWLAISYGWCRLAQTASRIRMSGLLTIPIFMLGLTYGQLSGEWVLGGAEGKCLAYGAAFCGLAAAADRQWLRCIFWFAFGVAFHIVTAGWVAIALALAILSEPLYQHAGVPGGAGLGGVWRGTLENFRRRPLLSGATILLAAALVAAGLLPVVLMSAPASTEVKLAAAEIYVYKRLPHHLSVRGFSSSRLIHSGLWVSAVAVWGMCLHLLRRYLALYVTERSPSSADQVAIAKRLLIATALMAMPLAFVGGLIDFWVGIDHPQLAAAWLRYYWFRWFDPAMALLPSLLLWPLLPIIRTVWMSARTRGHGQSAVLVAAGVVGLMLVPGIYHLGATAYANVTARVPPGVEVTLHKNFPEAATRLNNYQQWLEICRFARTETPADAMFLTPRRSQSFKWYAHRAEVVAWKDCPQNADDLVRWYDRFQDVYGPEGLNADAIADVSLLAAIRDKHPFDYVILDLFVHPTPPLLPLIFKTDSYAVFEMPPVPAEAPSP